MIFCNQKYKSIQKIQPKYFYDIKQINKIQLGNGLIIFLISIPILIHTVDHKAQVHQRRKYLKGPTALIK